MGCGSSHEVSPSTARPAPVPLPRPTRRWTPPGEAAVEGQPAPNRYLVPYPRANEDGTRYTGTEYDLTREDLLQGLALVASYLHRNRAEISIILIGGAVNTIFLGTRQSTRDADFFEAGPSSSQQRELLAAAIRYSVSQSRTPLGHEWLNNRVVRVIPQDLRPRLMEASKQQNTVVFKKPGLTVLAASWKYAFVAKCDRMFYDRRTPSARNYNAPDAAHYLHQYLKSKNRKSVPISVVKGWATEYNRAAADVVLREVDREYKKLYRRQGIDF